ncbi:hypothetical protein MTR67_046850 [Solanum verrucosum]|uniref:Cytochrome P450 n=1 Tax=Solanum verrucosum TaxID=315347 RepID=A0AAF0ZY04_SOLVR|nr:hypothetical protein MTR67_046847 [Solanum verrucosum]WMV53465.1 hypothetical protein MTR67_046850 [Solanum verrucosum]
MADIFPSYKFPHGLGGVKFDKYDVKELKYLKLVVKETLRLHPPIPLSVPRECREETDINGYTIPVKTKVLINVWALGRDPKYGNNFEFLPFGSGRRVCPGISFGLANIYLPLAQSLYHFNWKLPTGLD